MMDGAIGRIGLTGKKKHSIKRLPVKHSAITLSVYSCIDAVIILRIYSCTYTLQ